MSPIVYRRSKNTEKIAHLPRWQINQPFQKTAYNQRARTMQSNPLEKGALLVAPFAHEPPMQL